MGEIIATTTYKREKGYIYYTGTSKEGNLTLCRVKAGRGKKKKEVK